MAKYSVEITETAERQLRKLSKPDQIRLLKVIRALADEPFPYGCRKLQGYEHAFRLRMGVYRVIYTIENRRLTVVVMKIGHRKDVYR